LNGHLNDPASIVSPLAVNDQFVSYESSITKSLDFDKLVDKSEHMQQTLEPNNVQNELQLNAESEQGTCTEIEQQTNGEAQPPINGEIELKEEPQSIEARNLIEPTQESHTAAPREVDLIEQVTSNDFINNTPPVIHPVLTSFLTDLPNGKPENHACNGVSTQTDRSRKIQELEKIVQQQNDELVCLKSALNDTLRRLNLIENNQGTSAHSSSRAVSSSSLTTSFKKSANNSSSNLSNGNNSSKPPLSSAAKTVPKNVPRPGTNGHAKPQVA
jgi:hypothetical protein